MVARSRPANYDMIIECIANDPSKLGDVRLVRAYRDLVHMEQVDLRVGGRYVVYGIVHLQADGLIVPHYLLCTNEDDQYPVPYMAAFFAAYCGPVRSDWQLRYDAPGISWSLLPRLWIENPRFYEDLLNGDPHAVSCFESLKHLYARKP